MYYEKEEIKSPFTNQNEHNTVLNSMAINTPASPFKYVTRAEFTSLAVEDLKTHEMYIIREDLT